MANVPRSVIADAKRKAKELENFDCNKRRKSEIVLCPNDASSSQVESAFKLLNKFKNLPLGSMTTEEKLNVMTTLMKQ